MENNQPNQSNDYNKVETSQYQNQVISNKTKSIQFLTKQGSYRGKGRFYKKSYNQNRNNDEIYNNFEGEIRQVNKQFEKPRFNNRNNFHFHQNKHYSKRFNPNYLSREIYDPYMNQMMMYRAEMYIMDKYKNLINLNKNNENFTKTLSENDKIFIIKSFSEEDVHKSIKYGVWSSTKTGNQTLDAAYKMAAEKGSNVYLLFSCNGSGRYVGVARMTSQVDENKQFMYWTQDSKWPGLFNVEWVFIKDVPFRNFKHIFITMK